VVVKKKKTYIIVDLSTRYGLDGLGFESWKEKRFIFVLNCPDRRWGTLSLIFNGYLVSFPRIKRPGRKVDTHFHIVLRFLNECSYSSAPFYAFMA